MAKKLLAAIMSVALTATALLPIGENIGKIIKHKNLGANAMEICDSINLDEDSEDTIIFRSDISKAIITLSDTTFTYTGKAICPTVKVRKSPTAIKDLIQDKQYTVSYQNNVTPGTATVIITGIGQFKGTAKTTFTIKAPQAPAVVSGFKSAETSTSSVKLTWNKVAGAKGYIIYQAQAGKWVRIAKTTTNTNAYTVSGLKAGTTYKFAIKAYITAGKEISSASFPTVTVSTNPAAVTGFKTAASSSGAIKLAWNKVPGAKGYIIYQAKSGKWVRIAKTTTNDNTYLVSKLNASTTYKFAIKAYKVVNGKEVASKTYPTLTSSTCPPTVNFTLTAGSKKAVVKWSKLSGVTGYKIYYKTSDKGKWVDLKTTTATSYTKTGLIKGKRYYFTVRAYRTVAGKTYAGKFVTKSIIVK